MVRKFNSIRIEFWVFNQEGRNWMAKKRQYYRRSSNQFRAGLTNLGLILLAIVISAILLILLIDYQHAPSREEEQSVTVDSATTSEKQSFIDKIAPEAMKLKTTYSVFPSITIAQAILESDWGKSQLAAEYHNLFGVKADANQKFKEMTTQEYVDGKWETVTAKFRVYDSYADSILEHAQLFQNGTSWNADQYKNFKAATTYQAAAKALETDGYATDPGYAEKIIEIIEQYHLDQYDK